MRGKLDWERISLKITMKAGEVAGQSLPRSKFYYSTRLLCAPSVTGGKVYQIHVFHQPDGDGRAVAIAVYGSAAAVEQGKGILTHVRSVANGPAGKDWALGQHHQKLAKGYAVVPVPRRISAQDFFAVSPAGQMAGVKPVTEGLPLYPMGQAR